MSPPHVGGRIRPIRWEGEVQAVDPGRTLVWTTGLPGLLAIPFGFALQPDVGGVRVRHYVEVSGLAAFAVPDQVGRFLGVEATNRRAGQAQRWATQGGRRFLRDRNIVVA